MTQRRNSNQYVMSTYTQARNQGGETYLQNFSPPPWRNLLGIV